MKNVQPILLYDGMCNLCSWAINFIRKHDTEKKIRLITLQSKPGKEIRLKCSSVDSILFLRDNKVYVKSSALVEILRILPRPWRWLVVIKVIPEGIRDEIYDWIAKNRYYWFGKNRNCDININ